MPVYKDKERGTWFVSVYYTNWQGENKRKVKRGFSTKKEAQLWEADFLLETGGSMDMDFASFYEIYIRDMNGRTKRSTQATKGATFNTWILKYFGQKKMCDIQVKDIIAWQNEMMSARKKNGEPYASSYLKTLHNHLSAILNHARKYYGLKDNPAEIAGNMGKENKNEMLFWTQKEYKKFSESMMDKPISFYAFEMLYWCGIRKGELLALTPKDFNFEKKTVSINKTYQQIDGEEFVTDPKTKKSNRIIDMPDFLNEEMQDYIHSLYGIKENDRIFPISKGYLNKELKRGAKEQGVKRIRVHDLRHSHVSLLIDMGFSPVDIAQRMGHESIHITLHYAHMLPSKQREMASKLNEEWKGA